MLYGPGLYLAKWAVAITVKANYLLLSSMTTTISSVSDGLSPKQMSFGQAHALKVKFEPGSTSEAKLVNPMGFD